MKLTLVRHTSLDITPGVCYGQADVDVSENFVDESQQLLAKLNGRAFDIVYASPLQRCAKLAQVLDKGQVAYDDRLKELHFGDWEMQAWDEIPRPYFDEWSQNYGHMAPPNGETFAQLQSRAIDFIDEKVTQHDDVLCVTHGGMIRAIIAHILNMPLKGLFRVHVDYASVTEVEFCEEVPRINFVNR